MCQWTDWSVHWLQASHKCCLSQCACGIVQTRLIACHLFLLLLQFHPGAQWNLSAFSSYVPPQQVHQFRPGSWKKLTFWWQRLPVGTPKCDCPASTFLHPFLAFVEVKEFFFNAIHHLKHLYSKIELPALCLDRMFMSKGHTKEHFKMIGCFP